MRRRDFIKAIAGSGAVWPLAARAQQPAMPVVGYLNIGGSPESDASRLTGLRRGLNQTGYVEGRTSWNVCFVPKPLRVTAEPSASPPTLFLPEATSQRTKFHWSIY